MSENTKINPYVYAGNFTERRYSSVIVHAMKRESDLPPNHVSLCGNHTTGPVALDMPSIESVDNMLKLVGCPSCVHNLYNMIGAYGTGSEYFKNAGKLEEESEKSLKADTCYIVIFKAQGDHRDKRCGAVEAEVYTNIEDLNRYVDSLSPQGREYISVIRKAHLGQIYEIEEHSHYEVVPVK